MIYLQAHYYSLNKILLLAVGLWPYQQSKVTQFQCIFIFSTLSACIAFQLTPLISSKFTSDLFAKVLSSVSFFTIFMIKYIAFHLNINTDSLKHLQHIHNEIKDENEIAIVTKYKCIANRYTVLLTVVAICGTIIIIIIQLLSIMINVDISTNVSVSPRLLIMTEYFIDQEKYLYLILLHVYMTLCIGEIVMLAIGSLFITYLQHTCGMFRIASYRIKQAIKIDILQNVNQKSKILITRGIICAINIHRQAIKLSKHLLSIFEIMFFCLIVVGVTCLSLNLFQLFQITSSVNNIGELFPPLLYSSISILYMFLANYMGQDIINHNDNVYVTAYNAQWYKAPLNIQKMILFLLQRRAKEHTLDVGGLFHASIECFATLVKTSVSYFTVMYSTR
ncbi:hypothetical protein P5V15_008168 [Pogonomyrmex californicus]